MNPLQFLPEDSVVSEIQPRQWQVRLADDLTRFCLELRHEGAQSWLCFSAPVPLNRHHGDPGAPDASDKGGDAASLQQRWLEGLLDLQERFPAVKLAVPVNEPGRSVELRAEVPVAAGAGTADVWPQLLLEQFAAALDRMSGHVTEQPPADPPQPLEEEDLALLGELGYPLEADDAGVPRLRPAIGGRPRSLSVTRAGEWLHIEMPLSGGAVHVLEEPCRKALARYMAAVSGSVRLARAGRSVAGEDGGRTLGFSAAVPVAAGVGGLRHGTCAIVTAAQRYETEIEDLASEVLLAHAFGVIRGGAISMPSRTIEP